MIRIRRSADRGYADYGWLQTHHTFSFGHYDDPQYRGFRSLRVMNEDRVQPGQGFGMHGHRDVEIVTYVLEGALEHKDSLGNGSVLRPGELQRMTAGTGIRHSEFNPSQSEPVHLYQIWILPDRAGREPEYEQRPITAPPDDSGVRLIASPNGRNGSLTIHQDAGLFLANLNEGARLQHPVPPGHHCWLQILSGTAALVEQTLSAGDGAAISEESEVSLAATSETEIMLFDLA